MATCDPTKIKPLLLLDETCKNKYRNPFVFTNKKNLYTDAHFNDPISPDINDL